MATMKQIFGKMKKGLATGNFTLNGLVQTLQHYSEELENSTGGGGGGSTVSYTQTATSGGECGTIDIDGNSTKIYAPLQNAAGVGYDNTGSGLTATNVQDAIDEVAQGGGGGGAESVEVTGDGVKTFSQLLDSLFALIDATKITDRSAINVYDLTAHTSYKLTYFTASEYHFISYDFTATAAQYYKCNVKSSASELKTLSMNETSFNISDMSSSAATSGAKITLNY